MGWGSGETNVFYSDMVCARIVIEWSGERPNSSSLHSFIHSSPLSRSVARSERFIVKRAQTDSRLCRSVGRSQEEGGGRRADRSFACRGERDREDGATTEMFFSRKTRLPSLLFSRNWPILPLPQKAAFRQRGKWFGLFFQTTLRQSQLITS